MNQICIPLNGAELPKDQWLKISAYIKIVDDSPDETTYYIDQPTIRAGQEIVRIPVDSIHVEPPE